VRPQDATKDSAQLDLEEVAARIKAAERVIVLTGAGISTESGIPDFRGPQGLWTKDPAAEKLFTLQNYMRDRDLRVRSWQTRLEHPAWTAEPGPGHIALAELERKGKVHTLVTQNIDGLHQAAGTSDDVLVEIHGTLREVVCMDCGERRPMQAALDRVRAGEKDPPCRSCGGILKSATISFGQSLVRSDLERAQRAAETCEVFLAIGTSLVVSPVSYLPAIALQSGALLVIVNAEETPFDSQADAIFRQPIGTVVPPLVDLV
jgi:NAD-dependent deacetylase